jgi:hypothetical protein
VNRTGYFFAEMPQGGAGFGAVVLAPLRFITGTEKHPQALARSTRYALRRAVWISGSCWPIYAINESGDARLWGECAARVGGSVCRQGRSLGWHSLFPR